MYYFVFDVESCGLYGEGFAVAWTVRDGSGKELERGTLIAPLWRAEGDESDRAWVLQNVVPHLSEPNCPAPVSVRSKFWTVFQEWRAEGALFFAECGYPVESSFLAACVRDASEYDSDAKWKGPYPLHDVASVMLAADMDPMATYERRSDELPAHDPLADARLSARLLREALASIKGAK